MNLTDWPELPLVAWADTCNTLHLWTQVVGKIRLAHAPMINHWWQVPLYVGSRGLPTSPTPYGGPWVQTSLWTPPVELEGPIPFERDSDHRSYDPAFVHRFWRILVQVDRLF